MKRILVSARIWFLFIPEAGAFWCVKPDYQATAEVNVDSLQQIWETTMDWDGTVFSNWGTKCIRWGESSRLGGRIVSKGDFGLFNGSLS